MSYEPPDDGGYDQRSNPRQFKPLPEEEAERISREEGAGKWTPSQINKIYRDMGDPRNTPDDLRHFVYFCIEKNLNPLLNEVHAQTFSDKKVGYKITHIIHIEGARKIADLTGKYDGQDEPIFNTGVKGELVSATVRVYRKDCAHPFGATVYLAEYKAGGKWETMPHVMLSKCAEMAAFKKAFPAAMAGMYIPEEMDLAGSASKTTFDPPQSTGPGFAVGKKENGAPAPPTTVTAEAKAEPAKKPAEPAKPVDMNDPRARLAAVRQNICALDPNLTAPAVTGMMNAFYRAALNVPKTEKLPSDPLLYVPALGVIEPILADPERAKAFLADPAGAAKQPAKNLDAMFDEWGWQPLTRKGALVVMLKLNQTPDDFVLWITGHLKLNKRPEQDVIAFFALAGYTPDAYKALVIADHAKKPVLDVVSAIDKRIQASGKKGLGDATEADIQLAIDYVKDELSKPPIANVNEMPVEEEPAEALYGS